MLAIPKPTRAPDIKRLSVKDWLKGTVTAFDDGRTPTDGLRASGNIILDQDGTLRPRPSLVPYGTTLNTRSGSATVTTNLCTNPSIETNTTNWAASGAASAISRDNTNPYIGSWALKVTKSSSAYDGAAYTTSANAAQSTAYTASAYLLIPNGVTVDFQLYHDTGTADIGYLQVVGTGAYQRVSVTGTTRATNNTLSVYVRWSTTDTVYIDAVQIEQGTAMTNYLDGAQSNTDSTDYAWTGTAHASTSTRSVYAYGPAIVLGEVFEFSKTTGSTTEYYLCCVMNVNGTAKVYVAKDGGTWTVCNGKTYNTSADCHFCQIDNKVLVMNGVDNLSYLNIPTLTVVPFTALPAATITSATQTGMAGTTYTYYYQVSANSSIGETAASATTSVQVSTERDLWTPASQYVTVAWPAVAGATSYNVYLAETDPSSGGQGYLIASGVNGLSFKDDGTAAKNVNVPAPLGDTTAGPKVTRGTVINGQVFLTGDADNPRYIRFGGTGTSVLDLSPFNGGGWTEIGRGTKEFPVRVMPFRDGSGNSRITVLTKGTNGTGKRYTMTPATATIGSTVISYFQVDEENGQDGTDSPDGVVLYRDSLWYPSRDGFKTTGTKPQLQNILSTDTVSETIINDVKNLNSVNMGNAVGMAYQDRIYWALPVGGSSNDEIWVLDLARKGAWMKPWNIAADWMTLYNDNAGVTHQIVLSGNQLYELAYSQATMDGSIPFRTNATSGLIKFSEDSLEWANVIDITFIVLRPQGNISFTVAGQTEESTSLSTVGTASYSTSSTVAGWGEAGWGGSPDAAVPQTPLIFGWSNFSVVPAAFGDAQKMLTIEIDEELQWMTWELDTSGSGVDYQLADVVIRYVPIGVKDLS